MSDLKPGRALDALVAEKVMDWPVGLKIPRFSEDITVAWEVVEKLDFDMEIEQFLDSAKQRTYRVNFMERGRVQNLLGYAFSDTISEAICLAALKAVASASEASAEETK